MRRESQEGASVTVWDAVVTQLQSVGWAVQLGLAIRLAQAQCIQFGFAAAVASGCSACFAPLLLASLLDGSHIVKKRLNESVAEGWCIEIAHKAFDAVDALALQ